MMMNTKKPQVDTPRAGSWASTINTAPLPPAKPKQSVHLRTISAAEYKSLQPILHGR